MALTYPFAVVRRMAHPWLGVSAPQALRSVGLLAVAVVLVAVLAAVAVAWWRARRAGRTLSARVGIAMVPTDSFDPSSEEIVRFASQLSRVRPAVNLLTPSSSMACYLRLVSDGEGRMAMELEGPSRAASILELGGFDHVEQRPVGRPTGTSVEGAITEDPGKEGAGG